MLLKIVPFIALMISLAVVNNFVIHPLWGQLLFTAIAAAVAVYIAGRLGKKPHRQCIVKASPSAIRDLGSQAVNSQKHPYSAATSDTDSRRGHTTRHSHRATTAAICWPVHSRWVGL